MRPHISDSITRSAGCWIAVVLSTLVILSCSGDSATQPIAPNPGNLAPASEAYGDGRYLLGYWDIVVAPDLSSAEAAPGREAGKHWNILKFLEAGPCTNCLKVTGITPNPDGTVTVGVEIKHPFQNANLTGFDVRGIAMFKGSHTFTNSGLTSPDRYQGDGQLINADGYTALYNGSTAPKGPFEGYYDGKLAPPTIPSAQLNGFKVYASTLAGENTRNIFTAGDAVQSDFTLDMPDGSFIFGYAVDVSWAAPTVTPVTNPETDFPPEANCQEPWKITSTVVDGNLSNKGGSLSVIIRVLDNGGMSTHKVPVVECAELFNGTKTVLYFNDGAGYSLWTVSIPNDLPAAPGNYKVLIKVEDLENATSPPHLDLTGYQVMEVEVKEDKGFALTWGGLGFDSSYGVGVDPFGNVLVTGYFDSSTGGVDFDPGAGSDIHQSNGLLDIFLTKFNPFGEHVWTVTMGGAGLDVPLDLLMGTSGEILIGGYFMATVQFDPNGGGSGLRQSNGGTDAFMAMYDQDGNLTWVQNWGGLEDDGVNAISWYPSGYYSVGYFKGEVDFDPTPNIDTFASVGNFDSFMTWYDLDGTYIKAYSWGGAGLDNANCIVILSGTAVVAGYYEGLIDAAPSTGEMWLLYSSGFYDTYLIFFDPETGVLNGPPIEFKSSLNIIPNDLATPDSGGILALCGQFAGTADLNPWGTPDVRTSNGGYDAFIFYWSESFSYARTWGSTGNDAAYAVDMDTLGNIHTGGMFSGSVDFDPGAGFDQHIAAGFGDAFVTNYTLGGNYLWTQTFGSAGADDSVIKMASTPDKVFSAGGFAGPTDFQPGGGDVHNSAGLNDAFLVKYFSDGTW